MSKKLKNHQLKVEPASPSTLEEAPTPSLDPWKLLIPDVPSGGEAEKGEAEKLPKTQTLLSSTHDEKGECVFSAC